MTSTSTSQFKGSVAPEILFLWFALGSIFALAFGFASLVFFGSDPVALVSIESWIALFLTGPLVFFSIRTLDSWRAKTGWAEIWITACIAISLTLAFLAGLGSHMSLPGMLAYPASHIQMVPWAHLTLLILGFGVPTFVDLRRYYRYRRQLQVRL